MTIIFCWDVVSQSTNGMWGMSVICCWDVVSQCRNGNVGMTVICFWDMVIQSTNGDVVDYSNMFFGPGQSEYQCECGVSL